MYIAKKTTQLLDCQTLKQPQPQLTPPFAGPMCYRVPPPQLTPPFAGPMCYKVHALSRYHPQRLETQQHSRQGGLFSEDPGLWVG